jgi:hypothetical protein
VKTTSLLLPAAAIALVTMAIYAATVGAQAQQTAPPAAPQSDQPAASAPQSPSPEGTTPGGRPMRNYPPPTNLQVLPKELTGRQVREMMETWEGSLGVKCDFCHVADTKNPGPNGRPHLNFADDTKPNKQIARMMYTMMQQVNREYIAKAMDLDKDGMGSPVTCGTCHRGHSMPEDFVVPREEHREGPGTPATGPTPPAN